MTRVLVLLTCIGALLSSACIVDTTSPRPTNGDYYGSAYYYVEETDYIYDAYGYEQVALCSGTVLFSGWFDSVCDALISSEARYEDLLCDYYDIYGDYYTYYQTFYFPTGYISEYCSHGKLAQKNSGPSPDKISVDPNTQPNVQDGQIHAVVEGRTGKRLVSESLGKNITLEQFLSARSSGLVRKRDLTKPIEKIVTKDEVSALE